MDIEKTLKDMEADIEFDEFLHQYWFKGKETISVTQLLSKHKLTPDYSAVNSDTLKRASDRGKVIHKDIEKAINGDETTTMEADIYFKLIQDKNLTPVKAEFKVGNEIVCGTCDMLLKDNFGRYYIDDHKTGTSIHKYAVRWQGSIYAYLLGIYDEVESIICSHLPKDLDKCELIELPKVPIKEIERLFDCERNGEIYNSNDININGIEELYNLETFIKEIEEQMKEYCEKRDVLKKQVLEQLNQYSKDGVNYLDMKITKKNASIRKSVDAKQLKEDLPEIYEKYLKETKVNESLLITFGGNRNESI